MRNTVANAAEPEQSKKYYGGTVTVDGRNLITSLMAGETIEFTRIVVGSGSMPEGVEPIDMKELVTPVADAVSTIPVVKNGEMFLTVEYRNDLNGGLKEGFWLREFGIFAKTANRPEILLYYATLGDSPQPVNAYKDNRVDIRRYPVTIALELSANVQVSYNPGAFITAPEAEELLQSMVDKALSDVGAAIIKDITIPAEGWALDEDFGERGGMGRDDYRYYVDVVMADATAGHFPNVALHKSALAAAKEAGLCPTARADDGYVRLWARNEPSEPMEATIALLSGGEGGSSGGGGTYVLPVATSTRLGGIKVGKNLKITDDGVLSATGASVSDEDMASPTETDEMLNEVFPPKV